MKYNFPDDFIWGTSTSFFQIEDALHPSSFHDWKGLKGKDGTCLEHNIKHDHHITEDAALIASLGNSYRMSMDWSRLQSEPGAQFSISAVQHYRTLLGLLKDAGLHNMVVLHHFANPNWFSKLGGWLNPDSPALFCNYVKQMIDHFGDLVDLWNTINEPYVYAFFSNITGYFPPYSSARMDKFRRSLSNLASSHRAAYEMIKMHPVYSAAGAGFTKNATLFHPETIFSKPITALLNSLFIHNVNKLFSVGDFVAINYYGRVPFTWHPILEINSPGVLDKMGRQHDMVWEYFPQGLEDVLELFYKKYARPLIITEHGCCTLNDAFRKKSIFDHLDAINRASLKGVQVSGYYHWSTFDNYELHLGSTYPYGLIQIEPGTYKRILKPSALYYQEIIRQSKLYVNCKV